MLFRSWPSYSSEQVQQLPYSQIISLPRNPDNQAKTCMKASTALLRPRLKLAALLAIRPTADGSGTLLRHECFRTNLSIPDLLLLHCKAEVVDPPGTRNLAVQLFAGRSNHSHEQKPSVGQGREFGVLFRPTGGANKILRCHKNFERKYS